MVHAGSVAPILESRPVRVRSSWRTAEGVGAWAVTVEPLCPQAILAGPWACGGDPVTRQCRQWVRTYRARITTAIPLRAAPQLKSCACSGHVTLPSTMSAPGECRQLAWLLVVPAKHRSKRVPPAGPLPSVAMLRVARLSGLVHYHLRGPTPGCRHPHLMICSARSPAGQVTQHAIHSCE